MTPLMVAAEKGHLDAVTFIIEHGADVSLQVFVKQPFTMLSLVLMPHVRF